uniref:Uncharacterized protein n=1 Tax=Bird gammacoronavirus LimosaCN24 TaxID=3237966 RepID=A0AB39AFT7_9GAMC
MWFLEGGCSNNDWAAAYSVIFWWFCPLMDVVFLHLLVYYLQIEGFVVNNYRLWASG